MILRKLGTKLFPPANTRCISPPGRITEGKGKPIIVSSLMRTGTHLLIDLILNNFSSYRRAPLYIDLDQYVNSKLPADSLFSCGSYVIKSHYPQSKAAETIIDRLAADSFVIQPERELKDVYRSSLNFGYQRTYEELQEEKAEFNKFWGRFNVLSIGFDEITNTEKVPSIINRIADFSGAKPSGKTVFPLGRNEVNKVLLLKLATRILGRHSPYINTTIQFATTQQEKNVAHHS